MIIKKAIVAFMLFLTFSTAYFQSFSQANKPPYSSPVPKFTFAETLAGQEEPYNLPPIP